MTPQRLACGFGIVLASAFMHEPAANGQTLAELRTPSAPAFTLLGVAPSDVERPATPRAFAVTLLSALNERDDNLLPNGFAVEVAPYWLAAHPRLTFDVYAQPGTMQSLRQTLAFSAAATGSHVSVAVRASPLAGTLDSSARAIVQRLTVAQTRALVLDRLMEAADISATPLPSAINSRLDALAGAEVDIPAAQYRELLDEVRAALANAVAAPTETGLLRAALERLRTENDAAMEKAAVEIQRAFGRRTGFTLDLAAAVSGRRETAAAAGGVSRVGVWLTPAFSTNALAAAAVLRYIDQQEALAPGSFIDAGGRLSWTIGGLTLSGEAVHRVDRLKSDSQRTTDRIVANLEFKVNTDVSLTATFGKDYDDDRAAGATRTSGALSILGVSFGLGRRPDAGEER
jgi:hypothetical protein